MTTAIPVAHQIELLAGQLRDAGSLTDDIWRSLLHAVPRHLFAPDVAWAEPGSIGAPPARRIDRDADPVGWLDTIYSDMSIITQRDDGATDPATPDGAATCSLSAPGVVCSFLELLSPRPGSRVLEIGTGTGWTAGLLAARVGDQNVVSVEVDSSIAAIAAANLAQAGRTPRLVAKDGTAGMPGQLFDRLHVTCGVRTVPYAWVSQLKPGGIAVLPWMPEAGHGYQLKLTANGDSTATGTFHGHAGYMMLRSQRTSSVVWRPHHITDATTTRTPTDPRDIHAAGAGARLAITALVPAVTMTARPDDNGSLSLLLSETGNPDGSWAACDSGDAGQHTVTQYGPRRLWDETEAAYRTWLKLGRPASDHFGMTIRPASQQLWVNHPGSVLSA